MSLKYQYSFGWTRVAEMSYEDCLVSPTLIPVVVASRNGEVKGWHEAVTHAEVALCQQSTTLFNLDSVQEWALSEDNSRYEKVDSGLEVMEYVPPSSSLRASSKLAKRMLADLLTRRPSGWVEEALRILNTYRELLPRKLVLRALRAIPATTCETWEILTFNGEDFVQTEEEFSVVAEGEPNKLSHKLNKPKWEEGERPESHEGNAKSKQKWRRSGKEARRRFNR